MLSQGVVEEAESVGKQLGMGSNQSRLRFDLGGEALFEIFKGNIIEWACYPQSILVPGLTGPTKPPTLAIVGYPPESHYRSAQPRVGLNCRF